MTTTPTDTTATDFDQAAEPQPDYESAIALVGMAGRFPGASSVARLWDNLTLGVPGLRAIEDQEAIAAGLDPAVIADPEYVRVGGPLDGVELFDAAAFGLTDQEAGIMEPQHRLLLECVWEALECAGYRPTEPDGVVGLYAGSAFPDYMLRNLYMAKDPEKARSFVAGNERDSLTSLVNYKLGLRGPGVTVQSFCSTSLVAVHMACQSLLTYETDIALAGGASLPLPQPAGYVYLPGGVYSPDGRARPLDAEANGTVVGSGVGIVALKRMADALADGDVIHAVILGSAMNNDGHERAGYNAPGVDGQAEVIRAALSVAGVRPDSVGYLECHAIGTPLGDSIELAALSRIFKEDRPTGPCVLGSVKSSIGHLDYASGVTGLIRAALSLRHAVLPGVPGFRTPNPALAAAGGRFTVLTQDRPWPAGSEPRRAGVSSFGVGGTNVHLILEEPPARAPRPAAEGPHLLTFSAADEQALDHLTERLRDHLAEHRDEIGNIADIAYTLQVSRGRFALRRAVVCRDLDDAICALADPERWIGGLTRRRDPQVRLVARRDAPESGWPELGRAVASLLAQDPAACWPEGEGSDRTAALRALRAGLNRLGARILDDDETAATMTPTDVVELVVDPDPGPGGPAAWIVMALARLWLQGSSIDWTALHRGAGRRVELPTYPFQRRRHWIEPATTPSHDAQADPVAGRRTGAYLPTWRPRTRPIGDLDSRLRTAGPWLLLGDDHRMRALRRRLLIAGAEAMTVDRRAEDTGTETGLTGVLSDLVVAPRMIVHGCGVESASALENAVRWALPSARAGLVFLTSHAIGVCGMDLIHPEQAPISALAVQIGGRHIDMGAHADVDQTLAAMVYEYEGPTAVRGADAWVRSHELLDLGPDAPSRQGPGLQNDATVVIINGLDGVGLQLARYLAHERRCRLALIGRGGDETEAIAELEAAGAEALALGANINDEAAVRAALCAAMQRFGSIDVIVHAASDGFNVLQRVLGEAHGDETECRLIALCPDSASPAGAALEAFAHAARQQGLGRWLAFSWDTPDLADDADHEDNNQEQEQQAAARVALRFFEGALAASDHLAQVIVAKGSPQHKLMQRFSAATTAPGSKQGADIADAGHDSRPALAVPYVDPEEGLERSIADAWALALRVEPVGADDNFFELGGRSMTAVQLAVSIGTTQSVALPATAVVEYPTVRALATHISKLSAPAVK